MPVFAIIWPWIGLGAAGALLLVLFATDGLQANRAISRWRDLPWLVWLGLAAYLLHQFEEHGIDMQGQPYAFRGDLCAMLGFRDPIACPVPLSFVTVVNVGSVWGAGLVSVLLARKWPAIGLSFFAVPLVNAGVHLGAALVAGRYNPGLTTAVLLFVPLSLWAMAVAVRHAGVPRRALLLVVGGGVAVHVVLMGSLQAFLHGVIGVWLLDGVQVLNAFVPAALMAAGTGLLSGRRKAPPPAPPRSSAPPPRKSRAKAKVAV
ncbi:HXXEE domain-containing protein [Xanthobacteraceae bacterium A53D]